MLSETAHLLYGSDYCSLLDYSPAAAAAVAVLSSTFAAVAAAEHSFFPIELECERKQVCVCVRV